MKYWLIKSEPGSWSWDDQVRVGVEPWDGVRNYQATNNMKAMEIGDRAFFYHSVKEKCIVGIVEVGRIIIQITQTQRAGLVWLISRRSSLYPSPYHWRISRLTSDCQSLHL